MRVERLQAEFADRYDDFLLSRPETLLYQSWRYQRLLVELLGCAQEGLLAVDASGGVRAALPLMSMEGPFGKVVNSLPFYGSNGGLIGDDAEACEALSTEYARLVGSEGIATATVVENPLAPGRTASLMHDLTDERIGQLTPLPGSGDVAESLMQSFHSKTRNMVRKADKLGVEVHVDQEAMPFIISVHEENMREIGGIAKSRAFFEAIPRRFRPGQDYRIYLGCVDGSPAAALLVFLFNRTAEYFTPVVLKEKRETQALSAVVYRAMQDAARQGCLWWNWGGTWLTQDGVHRFKSRWGTEDRRYRYFTAVRSEAVLRASPGELRRAYPNFFVVPFSALRS